MSASTCRNPAQARFITEDILRFWHAFAEIDTPDAPAYFERTYLQAGTPGLNAFTSLRIGSASALVKTVRARRSYYAATRATTLAIARRTDVFRASSQALAAWYSAAIFPDTFFVIGRMTSGGTVADAGLLIGSELFARGPDTPVHELNSWERAVTTSAKTLPFIVAHELIHAQQPPEVSHTLLAHCLREGAAEFLGELISGGVITPRLHVFSRAHEPQLWARFAAERDKIGWDSWLYQGAAAGKEPADLGYFIGSQICRAHFDRSSDKKAAVHNIVIQAVLDPEEFLAASGYPERT